MTVNSNAFATTTAGLTALAAATGNNKLAVGIATVGAVASIIRKVNAGLTAGSQLPLGQLPSQAGWAGGEIDWRVTLSLPSATSYTSSPVLSPLVDSGNKLIFPYTPTVNVTHSASYNTLDTVHSNYPFLAYEHSRVEQISITAEFYNENSRDAEYWVAAVHYFRSVTKMSFGSETADAGQPPPIVKLNGYGDFVFKDIPVVVKSFTLDLPKDVDYISAKVGGQRDELDFGDAKWGGKSSYAPVKSTMNIVLMPIYSRTQVRKFNLGSFVRGDYVLGTQPGNGYL
jgi:hypothetical protein